MRILVVLFLFISLSAQAGFYLQPGFGYRTDSDDVSGDYEYANTNLILVLGGLFGKGGRWMVGQSFVKTTRSTKNGSTETELDVLELGPRIQYYLTKLRTSYIFVTYNLYCQGTRTMSGTAQDVDGTSTIIGFGYQIKMSRRSFLTLGLNSHTIGIAEQTVAGTTTDVSQTYTMIYPSLEVAYRF